MIAIVDAAVASEDLVLVRTALRRAALLRLGYLPLHSRLEFFQHFAAERGLAWTADQIELLTRSTGGYPLGMVARAASEAKAPPSGSGARPGRADA